MALWKRFFGESRSLQRRLEQQISQTLAEMTGCSIDEARSIARACIKKAKADARKAGTNALPANSGDILLQRERANPKLAQWLSAKRTEGVRDDDIRWYWNMPDLERRTLETMQEAILFSTWRSARSDGRTPEEAAVHSRKYHPYYGDPSDTKVTWGDDRPLPIELMNREDAWYERECIGDPTAFKNRLEGFSSYNALMRAEIRAGRL